MARTFVVNGPVLLELYKQHDTMKQHSSYYMALQPVETDILYRFHFAVPHVNSKLWHLQPPLPMEGFAVFRLLPFGYVSFHRASQYHSI